MKTLPVLRFLTLCVASLPASEAMPQSLPETIAQSHEPVPIHSAATDEGREYGLWASGRTYKVSFHDAVTFVPYLGADYPHNQPWSWATTSVSRGGNELATDMPQRWHDDHRFELRARAFVEAYDVRADGLEQTFVFDRAPRGGGDLWIHGTVTTMLRADPVRGHHGAVPFFDHRGAPIMSYGRGTVIDADGRTGPVYTSFDEGELSLRVPGAWLDRASYPVVVDPLFTTDASIQSVPIEGTDITVANSVAQLLRGYTIAASANDFDAVAERIPVDLSSRTVVYSDLTSSWSTPRVQCATAGPLSHFGVSIDRDFGTSFRVRVHVRSSSDFAFSTNVAFLNPPTTTHDWRSDIGGADLSTSPFTPTGDQFMVVWQRDAGVSPGNTNTSAIFGRTIDVNGNLGAEKGIAFGQFNPPDFERPSIVQQAVRTGTVSSSRTTWAVAYQHSPHGSAHWDVSISHVDDAAGSTSPRGITLGNNNDQLFAPQIAGRPGRYLVVFGRSSFTQVPFKSPLGEAHGVRAARIDWPVGGTASQPHTAVQIASSSNRSWRTGGCAYDIRSRSHWAITYGESRTGGGAGRTWCERVGYRGRSVENILVHDPMFLLEDSLPGGCTYCNYNDDFYPTWGSNRSASGTAWIGQLPQNGLTSLFPGGIACSPGWIGWQGTKRVGSEFCGSVLGSAPPGQLAWLLISTGGADVSLAPFGFPGCRLLVDNQSALVGMDVQITDASGRAFTPLPLDESLASLTVFTQWFHVAGPPSSPTLQSTQNLIIPIER